MDTTFDLDHYCDLIERVTDRHWNDYRSAEGLTYEQRLKRQCTLIGDFLAEVTRGDPSTGRAEVDHGVVFFVLNQTRWNGERRFTAWLNSDMVPIETNVRAADLPPFDEDKLTVDGSSVIVTAGNCSSDSLRRLWLTTWEEYRQHTDEWQRQSGLTTWNQLVLAKCLKPGILGITWRGTTDILPRCYHQVASDSLTSLGLPCPFSSDAKSSINFHELPQCLGELCPLHELEHKLALLRPVDEIRQSEGSGSPWHTLAACISYHLMRSYSIWGADAFLSIPITHRNYHPGGISVLSIGSIKPLSKNDITLWTKLAGRLFHPLWGDENFAELCLRTKLDQISPSSCYALTHKSLGDGKTLDHKLWERSEKNTEHADSVFKSEVFLQQLDQLRVTVPGIGEVSPCVLLRNEFGKDQSAPLSELAKSAVANQSIVADIRERLKGHVDVQIWVLKREVERFFKSELDRLGSSDGPENDQLKTPLEHSKFHSTEIVGQSSPRYILKPLFFDETSADSLIKVPDGLGGKARDYRFYVSPSALDEYLKFVRAGLENHLNECEVAADTVLLGVMVVHDLQADNGEPLVWLLICNSVSDNVTLSSDKEAGGTADELGRCAQHLDAFCCFDGYYQLGPNAGFVRGPRIHPRPVEDNPFTPMRHQRIANAVTTGLGQLRLSVENCRLFINGISLRVFPAESIHETASPDH